MHFVGLRFLLVVSALASQPLVASTSTTELRLDLRGGLRELPTDAELVAVAAADGSERRWPLRDMARLELPADKTWEVTCSAPGVWCPRLEIKDDPRLSLPVYRGVQVKGIVRAERGGELPETGELQGAIWEGDRPAEYQLRETLTLRDGEFAFQAPAAALDLRLAFEDWAPVYRWRFKTEIDGGPPDLGVLRLVAGASVAGWIRDRELDLPVERAVVTLAPLVTDWVPRARGLDHETRVDTHGFFQIRGVTPGRYRLEVGASSSAVLVLDEVEVTTDSETLLGALHLAPPVASLIRLDPAVDPEGGRWQVRLHPVRPLPEEAPVEVAAGEDGIAEVLGLRPAAYVVQVLAASGASLVHEEHEIDSDSVVEMSVPVIEFHGAVRRDEEPLEARVRLETGSGDAASFETDAQGEFRGFIRHPRWPFAFASVTWLDDGQERTAELELAIEVPEEGPFELEIEVPAQSVVGVVVDGKGRPVAGVTVTASPARPKRSRSVPRSETDGEGRFRLVGLHNELYHVQAKRGGVASEVSKIDLGSGVGAGELRLVLAPSRVVDGRVLTSQGEGLGGAEVRFEAGGRSPLSTSTISDWSGAFSLNLPEDAVDAVVLVFAPSQLLWSECVRLEMAEELVIQLPPLPGGTLLLETRWQPDLPPVSGGRPFVVSDRGGVFDMGTLLYWQRRKSGSGSSDASGTRTIAVPAVAPGSYAFVWSPGQIWELSAAACSGAFLGQGGGTLVAGGQAHLSIDLRKYQTRAKTGAGVE